MRPRFVEGNSWSWSIVPTNAWVDSAPSLVTVTVLAQAFS